MANLYDTDFYAWANEQAALLRNGQLAAADIENIAEEIESMGKSELRELDSRLTVLLQHLLKWLYQPGLRGASWEATIRVQRRDLVRHMAKNKGLKSELAESIEHAYGDAVLLAVGETGLSKDTFPAVCPWPYDRFMDPDFWPDQH